MFSPAITNRLTCNGGHSRACGRVLLRRTTMAATTVRLTILTTTVRALGSTMAADITDGIDNAAAVVWMARQDDLPGFFLSARRHLAFFIESRGTAPAASRTSPQRRVPRTGGR